VEACGHLCFSQILCHQLKAPGTCWVDGQVGPVVGVNTAYKRGILSRLGIEHGFFDFDVRVTVHRVKFLIIKPTRCSNFSNLFLEGNSTCFGQFLCQSSVVFQCTHSNCICHTGLQAACEQDQDVPS